jgi:nucleoside-triphosphatase THEP1
MDELGRFELEAPLFLAAVTQALDSPVPVVGVLKAESNLFLDGIRARPDVKVVTLDDSGAHAGARVAFEAAFRDLLRRSGLD